jgi:ribosomal protein L16/L10AE
LGRPSIADQIKVAICGWAEINSRQALRLGAMKLPIKTQTVQRKDWYAMAG